MSDSLQPHESQHARPPCPSPTPGVHSGEIIKKKKVGLRYRVRNGAGAILNVPGMLRNNKETSSWS